LLCNQWYSAPVTTDSVIFVADDGITDTTRCERVPRSGGVPDESLADQTIEQSIRDTEEPAHQLRKQLSALDLTVFALSFVFAGIACALAALSYAEFASTIPVAGSAYTFSYASLGELTAWIIGWDLILELALGASTVAVGWSTYFADVMKHANITIPSSPTARGTTSSPRGSSSS